MIDSKYITQTREPFFQIAKDLILPDSKILDIGAGDGSFSKYCGRTDIYQFDGNKDSVEKLRESYPDTYFGILPRLPFENDFFDLIHCSHVIEHLSPEELYDTLKEFDRCLKKGGFMVISTPLLWDSFYNDLSHIKPYNPHIFKKYLCENQGSILSRQKISENYQVLRLQYRFKEESFLEELYDTRNSIVVKIAFKVVGLLYRFGLRKYIKTGYTLVLKKELSQ